MAYVVAGFIFLVGISVAAIAAGSGFYGKVPLKIAAGVTVVSILVALTHDRIPSW